MDDEFRAFLETPDLGAGQRIRRRGHYSAFNWAVMILLLMGFAFATWIGSFYTFNHPENARCYKVLQALHKAEDPKRFEITAAPLGKFYSARELYDAFLVLPPATMESRNDDLLRNYLQNYSDHRMLVPYVSGKFTTLGLYELRSSDVFPAGIVAVAQSAECPEVLIEHVYPTQVGNIPKVRQMLATNPDIILAKTFDLSAIVHAEKLGDGRILFTVMPLSYGNYAFKPGISSTFRLDPPRNLHLEAGLPLVKADILPESEKMFAQYRKTKGLMARVKTPALPAASAAPEKTATAYSWVTDAPQVDADANANTADAAAPKPAAAPQKIAHAVPSATPEAAPVDEMADAPAPQEAQPENTPAVPQHQAIAKNQKPVAPAAPIAPIAQIEPPVEQAAPELPQPAQTAPVAMANSRPVVVPHPQPAAIAAATPVALPAVKPQKLTAGATTASQLPPNPTPAVGRPLAQARTTPNLSQIIAAMHTPGAKASPYAVAKPVTSPAPMVAKAATPARTTVKATEQSLSEAQMRAAFLAARAANEPQPATSNSNPQGATLQPFLAQQPAQQPVTQSIPSPPQPVRQAYWHTYAPGQVPQGKLIDWSELPAVAEGGVSREHYYLRGKYLVTASADNRVILRPQGIDGAAVSTVRIVVDFPAGSTIPQEGVPVSRGQMRPFQVTDVRRGNDGQLNVYAREITTSWNTTNTAELLRSYHSQRQRLANQYSLQ